MATQQINATQLALTPQQIQSMNPTDQAQFLSSLPANQRAVYQQEMVNLGNMNFMRNSLANDVFCPVTGGNGPTQNYVAGSTLFFDLPTTAGFAHELEILYTVNFTLAAGTNAVYAPTPAGKFAIFNRVELDYNGPQIVSHPYFTSKLLPDVLSGYQRSVQNAPGPYADQYLNTQLVGLQPTVVGANSWVGRQIIKLNPLSKESPYGMLPLSGVGNRPQLKLSTPSSLLGTDPLNNAIYTVSGTGGAISAVSGTIQVNCKFRDGKNLQGVTPYLLQNWQTMPTVQYYWESSLTPFNASGTINRFTIANKFEHWYAVAIIIDGQQSGSFISGWPNVVSFGLSPDFTAQQYFEAWNVANNIPIADYFQERVRKRFLQDLPDEGVIPWVVAPMSGIQNGDNQNGAQFLNMYAEGFPATTHSYAVTSTSTTAVARVELFLCSKNRAGLKIS